MNDATAVRAKNARLARLRERMKQLAYQEGDAKKIAALSAVILGLFDLLEDEL